MEAVIEYIKVHESVQSICHNTTYKRKKERKKERKKKNLDIN
jgi:hypothetical protein